jgi:preprotein translocase subunit SecG
MLLYYFITALHIVVCFILILVVLLQSGKGADLAGAFGGGGTQTAFGSRGPASFLSKATTIAAIIFMVTSILLSGLSTRGTTKSLMDNVKGGAIPAPVAPAKSATLPGAAKMLTPEQIKKQQEEIEAKQKKTPAQPAEKAAAPVAVPAGKDAPPPVKKDGAGK